MSAEYLDGYEGYPFEEPSRKKRVLTPTLDTMPRGKSPMRSSFALVSDPATHTVRVTDMDSGESIYIAEELIASYADTELVDIISAALNKQGGSR